MTEILSDGEVNQLLSAIDSLESKTQSRTLPDSSASISEKRIKIYDFRRPNKFSKEQARVIEMIHETFSRLATSSFSTLLQTLSELHVVRIEQMSFEDFVRAVQNPTAFAIVDMSPLKESGFIEIEPVIAFTILERLLGGSGQKVTIAREMTETELSVMENIFERILTLLHEAWRRMVEIRFYLVQIETNPQFVQIISPNEIMITITLNCQIGELEGLIKIAIPYITIEPVISKLSTRYWYSGAHDSYDMLKHSHVVENHLRNIRLPILAELGRTSLTMKDLMNLVKGDVLVLSDAKVKKPMPIWVGKKIKFQGLPGTYASKKSIKITKIVEPLQQSDVMGFEEK